MSGTWYAREPQNPNWAARTLPVSQDQSCVVCGSDDWAWLFPLDARPGRAFTFGPFLCSCEAHLADLDSDAEDRVATAMSSVADGDLEYAREYAEAFIADRLGQPLPRRVATGG
jgi:hypothetical protein